MRRAPSTVAFAVCWASMAAGQNIEIRLTPDEFAVFQNAVWNGSRTYGVPTEYKVQLSQTQPRSSMTMVQGGASHAQMWSLWMGEQSRDVMSGLDFNKLSDEDKHTLSIVQSVNRKLAQAKERPIYERVTVEGRVVAASVASPSHTEGSPSVSFELEQWHEALNTWTLELAGPMAQPLASQRWLNKPVVLTGLVRSTGALEVMRVVERKPGTIEIVTMSQCPFGVNAIKGVLAHLDDLRNAAPPTESDALSVESLGFNGTHRSPSSRHALDATAHEPASFGPRGENTPPALEIRYLFYKKPPPTMTDGQSVPPTPESPWWCMHGESELRENLVQMLIRDCHAELFFAYLRARLEQPSSDWKTIALLAGLTHEAIREIESSIVTDRDALIQAEYDYVSGLHGITDGSPTWIWESRVIADIRRIKRFKDLNLTGGSCAGSH